jgi:hypothetical protein
MSEVYTQIGPSLVCPDGSIEHGEVLVTDDGTPTRPDPADQRHVLAGISRAEYAARQQQWEDVLLPAARGIDPDFDETVKAADAQLDRPALEVIAIGTRDGQLPNGPLVLKWLAERPQEVEKINRMALTNPAKAQQRIVEISCDIAANYANANLDKADFATFRRERQKQIKALR